MKKTSKDTEEKICKDYLTDNYSSRQLGQKYNVSKTCILKILKRNNIQAVNRRLVNNNLVVDFFENIDSEEKAYLLGFIFADGCVSKGQFILRIQERDKALLYKIRELLNSGAKINTAQNGNSMMSTLAIKNDEFCRTLKKYGIIDNKTENTTHLPIDLIPKQFYKDFLRGLVDGDGWVIKTADGYYRIGFCTRYLSTAVDFKKMLNSLLEERWENKILTPNERIAIINIQKTSIVKQVALILYKNNKISLTRKFQMAQEIFCTK